jgi:hypothetical protein
VSTAERLAGHRALRRELGQNVLPRATSLDGRQFTLQAPLDASAFETGGHVAIGDRRGQLDVLEIRSVAAAEIGWSDATREAD